MKFHRTSIRKHKSGGYIVTNYAGHEFHVGTKERANEIASASRRVVKKRQARGR
jgi:hypothetical protein